jgi:polar amino acid transport system substrate-binding protein
MLPKEDFAMITPSLQRDLAPTGRLRVGINYANPVLARRDPTSGALSGVAPDLGIEIGRRTGLPVDLIGFESAGKMFDALQAGGWDIAFLAIDPKRADVIDFTAPYVEIEGTYLVPAGSSLRTVADVDRPGIRVGASAGSAYDLFLSRNLKHAELMRAASPNATFELIAAGKVDVLGGVRQHLIASSARLAGSRVFDDRFMAIEQALGIPKGHEAGAQYLREFIDDVKATGFVARALEKSGVRDVKVPPPRLSSPARGGG